MYDVIIIGAGVTGSAIARELAKKQRSILVLEKNSDVCEGTSKANSGICHGGFDAKPGSLKAVLNVRGNELMESLSKELDFSFKRNGSLVLCFDQNEIEKLEELKKQGEINGVKNLEILNRQEVLKREPNVNKEVVAALYAPSGGIVCPFGLTIALAENAAVNGVEFKFETAVENITAIDSGYQIQTNNGRFESKIVINAAGVFADKIHNMISSEKMKLIPRKGEYCLLDKKTGELANSTLFQLPTKYGKGILVTSTVHGNLLVGPTATDIEDKDGVNTTKSGLDEVVAKAKITMPELPMRQVITSFAGLRAHSPSGDFIIEEVKDAKGFIDVAGIESPGLTCAPAIGEYVADVVNELAPAKENVGFIAKRTGIANMALASVKERKKLIKENAAYANVICRCEMVTEGEILDAIHRPLGATTLDGVKRRTRAGMGRCQAGFCSPKTVHILARELGIDESQVKKSQAGSQSIVGTDKEGL